MRLSSNEFYLKSPDEMKETFRDIPEAIANTIKIAERCNVDFKLGESLLPATKRATAKIPSPFFRDWLNEGLERKIGADAA